MASEGLILAAVFLRGTTTPKKIIAVKSCFEERGRKGLLDLRKKGAPPSPPRLSASQRLEDFPKMQKCSRRKQTNGTDLRSAVSKKGQTVWGFLFLSLCPAQRKLQEQQSQNKYQINTISLFFFFLQQSPSG